MTVHEPSVLRSPFVILRRRARAIGLIVSASAALLGSSRAQAPMDVQERAWTTAAPAEPEAQILDAEQPRIEGANSYFVHLHDGEFVWQQEDLRIPGVGFDFVWTRTYRSKLEYDGPIGNSWDHSYNVFVEASGADLILHDGTGRADLFASTGGGTWVNGSQAREISVDGATGEYVVTHRHNAVWRLAGFGSAWGGKLASIVDRNSNTMTFDYDAAGRLTQITDTLGRVVTVFYNAAGRISEIEDFATAYGLGGRGRVVAYAYHRVTSPNGNPGDLATVKLPAIVGTITGNDFPLGRTWAFEYAKVASSPPPNTVAERRNLLTITDPNGDLFLTNAYDVVGTYAFDTVASQVLHGATDSAFKYTYAQVSPSAANGFANGKTIVNDRVGNVRELFYDANKLVLCREFTGRADPALPTTDVANRPANPLRSDDPAYFETRFEYASNLLVNRITHPAGNQVERVFDTISSDPRSRGDLLVERHLPGPLQADQAMLCERWAYDSIYHFVRAHFDPNGNYEQWDFDGGGWTGPMLDCFATAAAPVPVSFEAASAAAKGSAKLSGNGGNNTSTNCPSPESDGAHGSDSCTNCIQSSYNGSGQITLSTDELGTTTEAVYYASGPSKGYAEKFVLDPSGLALETQFIYDDVGNLAGNVDAKGYLIAHEHNAANWLVRTVEPHPGRETRYVYDALGQLIRKEVLNHDDFGLVTVNPWITTSYEYDPLGNRTRVVREVDPTHDVIDEFEYDDNENVVLHRKGEAVNGHQPSNVVAHVYDERDMVFKRSLAAGSADQSTTQWDYDLNRNVKRIARGIESASPRVTLNAFDGYERIKTTTDPMGNVEIYVYDANGNNVSGTRLGELVDVPGQSQNTLLLEYTQHYDARNLPDVIQMSHFSYDAQGTLVYGPQHPATFVTEYDGGARVRAWTDANQRRTEWDYDVLDRLVEVRDPELNVMRVTEYDANSNARKVEEVDRSGVGADRTLETETFYDSLDRAIVQVDPAGHSTIHKYDSRGNVVVRIDANGNQTRFVYDGVDRPIATVVDIDGNGASLSDPLDMVTRIEWDDSMRVVARIDPNGNAQRYAYDGLDRMIVNQHADGALDQVGIGASWALGAPSPDLTSFVSGYDVHGNAVTRVDGNGSVVTTTFDLNDRATSRSVQRATIAGGGGADVLGTTWETFAYDGYNRLVAAADDDSSISRRFDSLNGVVSETQTVAGGRARVVENAVDPSGNALSTSYPGGRSIAATYDGLNRKSQVVDAGQTIATFDYLGRNLIERRAFINGVQSTFDYHYDRQTVRAPKSIVTEYAPSSNVRDQRDYAWDGAGNRLSTTLAYDGVPRHHREFSYDRAYRMLQSRIEDPLGVPTHEVIYSLDHANNRTYLVTSVGAPDPDEGAYFKTAGAPLFDAEMNRYTFPPNANHRYDRNGNLVAVYDGAGTQLLREYKYDFADRMVECVDVAQAQTHRYAYDCFGRRIQKHTNVGSAQQKYVRFYYGGKDQWQVLEEQDQVGRTRATYVYGNDIDDVASVDRDTNGDTIPERYFFARDDQMNVVAAFDVFGSLVERYDYSDYGTPVIMDASGNVLAQSAIRNKHLFTGHYFDEETGLYYFRTRYYDPVFGRYTTRDSIGVWGDSAQRGNGYSYAENNPWSRRDPMGTTGQQGGQSGGGQGSSSSQSSSGGGSSSSSTAGTAAQGAAVHAGSTANTMGQNREKYDADAKKLDPKDPNRKAARDALKAATREADCATGRACAAAYDEARGGSRGGAGKPGDNVNKTDPKANKAGKALKTGGRVVVVASVAVAAHNVATAPEGQRAETAVKEAGALAGGIAGGAAGAKLGATVGALGGPVGAAAGAIAGGLIGGALGALGADALISSWFD